MARTANNAPVPECPAYLGGTLRARWAELAGPLSADGVLDSMTAGLLAKYLLAENEYLKISEHVQLAVNGDPAHGIAPDADAAGKWLAAQDRLTKQILALGGELGLTPRSRRARGIAIR